MFCWPSRWAVDASWKQALNKFRNESSILLILNSLDPEVEMWILGNLKQPISSATHLLNLVDGVAMRDLFQLIISNYNDKNRHRYAQGLKSILVD